MQIDYTALRTLKSGHTAGTDYQIDVDLADQTKQRSVIGNRHIALAGGSTTVIHRVQTVYQLTTTLISSSTTPDLDDMREFLDSVMAGEQFQLDIEGSSENYVIDAIGNPYNESRNHPNMFRFSFSVRKL